jgi:hypothetical protein
MQHYRSAALKRAAWLFVIVVLVVVRTDALEHRLFSNDESFTWRMCQYSMEEVLQRLPSDAHPPLHYVLWNGWATIWGDSIRSLRGLAILCGLVSIFVLCKMNADIAHESLWRLQIREGSDEKGAYFFNASLFVALLGSFSIGQIFAGSNARMYPLGLVFAMLSAWSLWRALHCDGGSSWWWTTYGLVTAAFCYTHYFAFLAVLGQAIFLLGWCLSNRWQSNAPSAGITSCFSVRRSLLGWAYAMVFVAIVYVPWIPTFMCQLGEVQDRWWIPPVTPHLLARIGFEWLIGMRLQESLISITMAGLLGILIVWTLWRGGAAAWFFFLQAFVPWVCVIAVQFFTHTSLLQLHYFVFAHAALLGLWGVCWQIMSGWKTRTLLAVVLGVPMVWGFVEYHKQLPHGPSALAKASAFVKEHYSESDWFFLDDHRKVNLFRYYTMDAGLPWVAVKCHLSPFRDGHIVHIASLEGSEVCWSENYIWDNAPSRVWCVQTSDAHANRPAQNWRLLLQQVFNGAAGTKCTLMLYELE